LRQIHQKLGLSRVINARGTYTPLGVSRSSEPVIEAVAESLRHFFVMDDLRHLFGDEVSKATGAEWATVTHCTAASITLSVAALMTGDNADNIRQLPDTNGMNNRFVIQAGHCVNYGQAIEQAIRLAGAQIVVAGSEDTCTEAQLQQALEGNGVGGLVLVQSRLCKGDMVEAKAAVALARARGIGVIMDAAAQDLIMGKVLEIDADLSLFSAQKYLASPTAGLVLGRRDRVEAVSLQESGIGRGMKAGKEAIIGTLMALRQRHELKFDAWISNRLYRAQTFADAVSRLGPLSAELVPDPLGNPFSRVRISVDTQECGKTAPELADALAASDPAVIVQDHDDQQNSLMLEVLALDDQELEIIVSLLAVIVFKRPPSGMRKRNIEDW
jgi:uncharacterized pyridoxal phosphate-dependent enzyme